MSAIAGLLRFDGGCVRRHELERAANALRRCGPDRSDVFAAGSVGLAHVLMRMTPEDRFDRQPSRGASGAMITADLRLDNRDDMLGRIAMTRNETAEWADARVVLAAWEKFGDDIWPMLRGPFAAAIWDPRERAMTLARDHLGLGVVLWHRSDRFFAFATLPNGLFAFAGVPRELSEEKFADFLVLNHADHATTMYRQVFRVPPAYVLRIGGDGATRQHRYWSPAGVAPIRLGSDQAYADGLREHLDSAVRRQMRSAHPIGCLLSGGLDSSAVAVLAAGALADKRERLAAFTGRPRRGFAGTPPAGCYVDEAPYVEAIARGAGNIDVTYVHDDDGDDLAELKRFLVTLEGPVRNPANLAWVFAILRRARVEGRRVLLGGLCGNQTISWNGWSQAAGHLRRGRLFTAFRQWHLFYRLTPYSRSAALRTLFFEPLLPERLGDAAGRLRRWKRGPAWQDHAPIRADFAAAMAVDARAKQVGHDFLYRMRHDDRVQGLIQADYVGDWHAAEKAFTGVEVRDPTADVDVVSYCFGVPPEQYLAEGVDRSLIRRAMWGLLPEKVLTNRLSGLQAADWYEKLDARRALLAREVAELSQSALVRRMIDLERLQRAIKSWPAGGWDGPEVFREYNLAFTRGVAGGQFLRWFESAN